MFGTFHNEVYDGVVLKIPSWFIEMNNLGGDLDAFLEKLQSEKILSAMHPDHRNNVYELENRARKKEIMATRNAHQREREKLESERTDRLLDGREHPLAWKTKICIGEKVVINREWYEFDELFTKSGDIMASKKNLLQIQSWDDLVKFATANKNEFHTLYTDVMSSTEELIELSSVRMYKSGAWNIGIKWDRLVAGHAYRRDTKTGRTLRFYQGRVLKVNEHYAIDPMTNNTPLVLEGFKRIGFTLIKQD